MTARSDRRQTVMPSPRGTYALVLTSPSAGPVRIGKLGTLQVQPGCYVYVGSAFGPGGLAARLQHHQRIAAWPHWHIDHLRTVCALVEIWFTTSATHREHWWARALARMPGASVPMAGFGSSDCDCESHLFWFERLPSVRMFGRCVRTPVSRARTAGAQCPSVTV